MWMDMLPAHMGHWLRGWDNPFCSSVNLELSSCLYRGPPNYGVWVPRQKTGYPTESLAGGQDEVGADCIRQRWNWAGHKPTVRFPSTQCYVNTFWKRIYSLSPIHSNSNQVEEPLLEGAQHGAGWNLLLRGFYAIVHVWVSFLVSLVFAESATKGISHDPS